MNSLIKNYKGRQMMIRILLKQKKKKNILLNSKKKDQKILKRNFIVPRAFGVGNLDKPTPLGRWSVEKNKYEQDSVVDWANHDHCGSQSCKLEDEIKEVKDWVRFIEKNKEEKKKEEEKNNKTEKIQDFTQEDYIQNYMTSFII